MLTFTSYFGCCTVAVTVCVPIFSQYGAARQHLLLVHPDDRRFELIGRLHGWLCAAQITSPREQSISVGEASV